MPEAPLPRAVLCWSGGKDSAWALERVRGKCEIVALITTVDESSGRVPIHEISRDLIHAQADSLGIPLWTVPLPRPCSNGDYLARMRRIYAEAKSAGADRIIFGDLFLADIRKFREDSLVDSGLTPMFPLWRIPTTSLAREMVDGGLRAILTSVDRKRLPGDCAGRVFGSFELPANVDPCGENGEFHTFAFDGPMFRGRVKVEVQRMHEDECYAYAELRGIPGPAPPPNICPESSL